MKPYILIIEDDPDIAESIRYNLERDAAFTAQATLTGEEGLAAALGRPGGARRPDGSTAAPDLIILDLNLPGMNGFELCRRLRTEQATRRTPIIVLTARTEESDKVRGLELGADDYVTKPFSVRELVARVRAALRRSGFDTQMPANYDDGNLIIDYPDFAVFCQGQRVKLTRKEFALLSILSRNKGRVVPREQLLDQVWGLEYYGEARTLDVHISGLRKKLGVCGGCIETMIGIGYRFRGCADPVEAAGN
ncbi:MAG: response regulator transcription factor [Acidobacteria bacterium]|nr:response regulator transcription factor [Acidobacteriota bacterium]MCW5971205.1 response regulator transcription factor [Blastocatellales bacterium]